MTITKERSVNEGEDERVQGATICKLESLLKRSHLQRIMKRKKIFTYLCNESVPSRNCVSTRQRDCEQKLTNVHQCGRPRSESTDNSISIYIYLVSRIFRRGRNMNFPTWKEREYNARTTYSRTRKCKAQKMVVHSTVQGNMVSHSKDTREWLPLKNGPTIGPQSTKMANNLAPTKKMHSH